MSKYEKLKKWDRVKIGDGSLFPRECGIICKISPNLNSNSDGKLFSFALVEFKSRPRSMWLTTLDLTLISRKQRKLSSGE